MLISNKEIDEIVRYSYEYCNLQYGDPSLLSCIVDKIAELAATKDWSLVEKYLGMEGDPLFLLNRNVLFSHCSSQIGFDKSIIKNCFDPCGLLMRWADSLSIFLLNIVKQTKYHDSLVQQIMNYDGFLHYEMWLTPERKKIACEIYDLRGVDFFLIHHMGGVTLAFEDDVLWCGANLIVGFLKDLGREEESSYVAEEIESRKNNFKEISTDYSSAKTEPIAETIEKIRLIGERFWIDYLSLDVWQKIDALSCRELIDAFVTEIMLEKGVLRGWSQVVLSLCKVLEREIADALFLKWIDPIKKSTFNIPPNTSAKTLKRIKSREITFNTLKACSESPLRPPTLGQLLFIARFWTDNIMNQCTKLFSSINELALPFCTDYALKVQELSRLLEDRNSYNEENPSYLDLRNASAHPGHEDEFTWNSHVFWLKESLGQPPKEILRLVVGLKNIGDINK